MLPKTCDWGKCGDPAGNIVRHLRIGEEADEPLVCGLRTGGRAAGERMALAQPAASGIEASVRANLSSQAGGRIHGESDRGAARRRQRWLRPGGCVEQAARRTDTSLTSGAAYVEVESSARLITPAPAPAPPRRFKAPGGAGDDAGKTTLRLRAAAGRAAALCLAQLAGGSMGTGAGT